MLCCTLVNAQIRDLKREIRDLCDQHSALSQEHSNLASERLLSLEQARAFELVAPVASPAPGHAASCPPPHSPALHACPPQELQAASDAAPEPSGTIALGATELNPEVTERMRRLEAENASFREQVRRAPGTVRTGGQSLLLGWGAKATAGMASRESRWPVPEGMACPCLRRLAELLSAQSLARF